MKLRQSYSLLICVSLPDFFVNPSSLRLKTAFFFSRLLWVKIFAESLRWSFISFRTKKYEKTGSHDFQGRGVFLFRKEKQSLSVWKRQSKNEGTVGTIG